LLPVSVGPASFQMYDSASGEPFTIYTAKSAAGAMQMRYAAQGKGEGAVLLVAGGRARLDGDERGYWVEPTVFDRVAPDQTLAQEEVFGPVLVTLTFADEDEAIDLANRTIYGLAAAVWTQHVKRAHRLARRIQAGTIWVNTYHPLSAASPFGGYKQSGYGRELGRYALDLYTQVKSVWVDLH
jgi:aldehyde dehydrogenase (NAD+)